MYQLINLNWYSLTITCSPREKGVANSLTPWIEFATYISVTNKSLEKKQTRKNKINFSFSVARCLVNRLLSLLPHFIVVFFFALMLDQTWNEDRWNCSNRFYWKIFSRWSCTLSKFNIELLITLYYLFILKAITERLTF